MRKNIPTLLPDTIYQIFNRGINSETLFKLRGNYSFFIQKMHRYLLPVADLYAYCLMKDHFHLCLRTHTEDAIRSNFKPDLHADIHQLKSCSWHISNQFASLFKSYAQSINKAFDRTGGLFEEPFRRIEIKGETELRWSISYVHNNPKLHGLDLDYTVYPYSSYGHLISGRNTKLNRDFVLSAFDGLQNFETFHQRHIPFHILDKISLE